MDWKNLPDRIYKLLIINSLHRIEDEFNIHGVVSGTIVSIYGILIGMIAWFLFVPFNLVHSAIIIQLGIFSYLAILNHHILELVKESGKDMAHIFLRVVSTIALIVVYLLLIDGAIGLGKFFINVRILFGVSNTLLWSVPGLIILILPLLLWEPLCRVTPVDEIVESAFK